MSQGRLPSQGRILIVEDERSLAHACRSILEEHGHHAEFCLTGREGRALLRRGDFDVVLLDLRLGDMDGMEILEEARRQNLRACMVIMTAFSTVQNAVKAMKLGAFDYLTKPFTDDELILCVQRAVEKKRLVEENLRLKKELVDRYGFSNIVGENPKILEVFRQIEKVAPTDCTVLIHGEHGTGKELVARAVHARSERCDRPFLAINCGAFTEELLANELFGHEKEAFTGARSTKKGLLESAQGGTVFLDEIGEMPPTMQVKLLRVLQERRLIRVGGTEEIPVDIRVWPPPTAISSKK